MQAPRTCVTKLQVSATSKREAERLARNIVKHNTEPMIWNPAATLSSLGIETKVLAA